MKTRNSKTKAFAFLGAAFVLLIALIFTGCPHKPESGGGTGGGNQTSSITVRFDETTIKVAAKGDDGDFHYISTGTAVSEGKSLRFFSKNLPSDKQVDKWKVNTKELDSNNYTVNAADAVDEGSDKVITVAYTLKQALPVIVQFDETTIRVLVDDDGGFYYISTDTAVSEGKSLLFFSKNLPPGKQIDKWKVNTKELDSDSYKVNAADAVDNGSNKVITVSYTLKEALPVIVRFNDSEIKVKKKNAGDINNGDTVYEGAWLYFYAKNLPSDQQLTGWKVNEKVRNSYSYKVDAADAVDNGSNKVITVTYTAQTGVNPVFVVFDSRLVTVYDPLSGLLESGNRVYEGTNLVVFTPDTGEEYLTFVNAKKLTGSSYTVNAADAIDEGGQKVIRIWLTVPNPKTLTVQFNSADIECKTFDGTAITPISPGYKGPAYTYVMLKAKTPMGKSVKHWEINGNIIGASEGAEWLEGQADPAVATPDGTITISVIFE